MTQIDCAVPRSDAPPYFDATMYDVSVLVVNYNTADLLEPCIGALRRAAVGLHLQVIVVDNASRDDSVAVLRRDFSDCELIVNTENVGFGRANNQAMALARGRFVLLLNTDAFVSPDTLFKTVGYMDANVCCGVLGVRLLCENGEQQASCRNFPTLLGSFVASAGLPRWLPWVRLVDDRDWNPTVTRRCDWVPGCYFLVRREVINEVGLFDPRFFMYFEEVDHCRAAQRAGWEVVYFADTTVVHLGGASANSQNEMPVSRDRQIVPLQIESALLYFRKHGGVPGVLAALLGTAASDGVQALRSLLLGRSLTEMLAPVLHFAVVWRLFRLTSMGSKPTR